jgi:hypothetical protein
LAIASPLAACLATPGFIVDFISFPVINGFTTSAAITIGFGEVKVCGAPLRLHRHCSLTAMHPPACVWPQQHPQALY